MENNAVCLINLKLFAIHDHIIVLVIYTEKGHGVRLMAKTPEIYRGRAFSLYHQRDEKLY